MIGRLRETEMEAKTAETMKGLSVTTIRSIRQKVASLSGGQRQSVAVARAVMWNSRLVILDEPTAALGVAQTRQVLELVKRLAEQGLAVVIISHNLHDIFEVATGSRCCASAGRSRSSSASRRRSRRSSTRSPPACRRRSPASRGTGDPASSPRRSRSRDDADAIPRPSRRRSPRPAATGNGVGAHIGRWFDNVRAGDVGQPADHRRAAPDHAVLPDEERELPHRREREQPDRRRWRGTTTIAMGVVFVLLLGEIDLSIGFVSGIAGVVVAELQTGGNWTALPGWLAIVVAVARVRGDRRCWRARSSPSSACPRSSSRSPFLLALQGVIQKLIGVTGVIVIQDQTIFNVANYFLADTWGWICAAVADRRSTRSARSRASSAGAGTGSSRTTSSLVAIKLAVVAAVIVFVVWWLNDKAARRSRSSACS